MEKTIIKAEYLTTLILMDAPALLIGVLVLATGRLDLAISKGHAILAERKSRFYLALPKLHKLRIMLLTNYLRQLLTTVENLVGIIELAATLNCDTYFAKPCYS
ncbi:hypothetical protein THERMOS_380 [Bathymodiolus thermophilus thioautotrophic gill symbiont]|uniref:Uncharacterized protein n=1 Tax=Bathymodiolus thermophilus thioautotrophic gill symbiont TaxID=2360 RepID=A0A8H8XAK1_9GAMM|nr:hypothetical protein THERMOS_380 [Bathymodiolus thermophilus thioautotrophic gill symbiont]